MTGNHLPVPFRNSNWVVRGRFLTGEHLSISQEGTTGVRLAALLTAGIRTFALCFGGNGRIGTVVGC